MRVSVLEDILVGVREDLARRQADTPLERLKQRAAERSAPLDGFAALSGSDVSVITEVKRSSPSRGELAPITDPAALATAYADGGAHAISVVTEERWFTGSLDDLVAIRQAVDVPLLRKDFVVSSYQLWEARAFGADLVLLIVAALEQEALVSLVERAQSIGLTPLVEVHDEEEVPRALAAGARIIGVNARDLRTMEVDRDRFAQLAEIMPSYVVKIAESGVRDTRDLLSYAQAGADAVLVGESLVKRADPRQAVAELVTAGAHPACRHGP